MLILKSEVCLETCLQASYRRLLVQNSDDMRSSFVFVLWVLVALYAFLGLAACRLPPPVLFRLVHRLQLIESE